MTAPVWLVVGAQGAGKSTVAQLLAEGWPRSVHVRGGEAYRWAVNGWAHPVGREPEGEARRHLDLRYRISARIADEYCAAGFTTVVQDNLYAADVTTWLDTVVARPRHLVVLRPRVEVVVARDAERQATTGKVAYRPGDATAEDLDAALGRIAPVGLWLDTSDQTPAQTVAEIRSRAAEAEVP